jgi:hypothetical protein
MADDRIKRKHKQRNMTNEEKKDKRNRTGVNLNEQIVEDIKLLAQKEKRTLTAQVHVLLEFALESWQSDSALQLTPELVQARFEAIGRVGVKQLVLAGIEYLFSDAAPPTDEEGQLAVAFLKKLVSSQATDGDAIELAEALELDTAALRALSQLVSSTKGGKKASNGV